MPAQPPAKVPAKVPPKSGTTAAAQAVIQARIDDAYILSFTAAEASHKTAKALAGEYVADGNRNGRTYYKKRKVAMDKGDNADSEDVFCYFEEDAWWLGPRLGGMNVWAKSDSSDPVVPKGGWRMPWDGAVREGMSFLSKKFVIERAKQRRQQAQADQRQEKQRELEQQADQVLQRKQAKLEGAQFADAKVIIEAVETKVQAAEDFVEKASILAEEVSEGWELDHDFVESKLVDTEGAVEEAEEAHSKAERSINQETVKLRKMEAAPREHTLGEFAKLKAQLLASHRKLNTLKGSRKEVQDKQAAKKLAGELQDQLTNCELSLDEASRLIGTLSDEAPTNEELVVAEEGLTNAQNDLSSMKKRLESFSNDKRVIVKEKVPIMQERLKSAEQRLPEMKKSLMDGVKRREVQEIIQEAEVKMQDVFEKVDKASEMDSAGTSEGTANQILEAVEHTGTARTAAQVALSSVRSFVLQKYVEVSRFPETMNQKGKQSLEAFKEQLADVATKLDAMRLANLERKHQVLLRQVVEALEKAEDLSKKVVDAASPLADDSQLLGTPSAEITAACDNTGKAEDQANDALVEAQKLITALQIEARGKDTPAAFKEQLTSFSTRVVQASQTVSDGKKLATSVNQRIAIQHLLKTARGKVEATDGLVNLAIQAISKLDSPTPKAVASEESKLEQDVAGLETKAKDEAEQKDTIQPDVSKEVVGEKKEQETGKSEVSKEVVGEKEEQEPGKPEVGKEVVGDKKEQETGKPEVSKEVVGEKEEQEARIKALTDAMKIAEKVLTEAQLAVQTTDIFLETKVRLSGTSNEELKGLGPRNKKLAEKLNSARSRLKARSETISVETMLFEARARMTETEDAVAKAVQAETDFLKSLEETPTEASRSIWTDLQSAVQAAQDLVGSTKTFLAMKRIAARQLSSESASQPNKVLAEVQSQLDISNRQLHQVLAKVPERRVAAVQHEMSSHVQVAKRLIAEAQEGSALLAKVANDANLPPDEMKDICSKADSAWQAAQASVVSARSLVEKRKKETLLERKAKEKEDGEKGNVSDSMAALEDFLSEVVSMEKVLAELKAAVSESEHRFVAKRLAKEATNVVEEAEKKHSDAKHCADPLVSDENQELAHCITVNYMVEALKAHFRKLSKNAKDAFREMRGDKDSEGEVVTQSQFVGFMCRLSEDADAGFPKYSEDELRLIFAYMDADKTEVLSEANFLEHFRIRYECVAPVSITTGQEIKGSKARRKLAVNEIFLATDQPEKDSSLGIIRVFGTAEKDMLEGWVTVAGNQGTVFLSSSTEYDACLKKVEVALREAEDVSSQVSVHLKTKIGDLRGVRSGPLAEAKEEITRLLARLKNLDSKQRELREQVVAGKQKIKQYIDKEKTRQQQVSERKFAVSITNESNKLVTEAEEATSPAAAAAEALLRPGTLSASDDPVKAVQEASKAMAEALQVITRALADLQAKAESTKKAASGPLAEARGEMAKIKVRLGSVEVKCKRLQSALSEAQTSLVQEAHQIIRTALLKHIEETGTTASSLYNSLQPADADASVPVPVSRLRELLLSLPGCSKLPAYQLDIGLVQFGRGMTRFSLLASLREYRQCIREVGLLRDGAPAEEGAAPAAEKPIRLLKNGELVEVTGATDALGKIPCCTLLDAKQGFIPVRSEDDEECSKIAGKPYYCFSSALSLQKGLRSSSETIRKLRIGEVMEVLQGPKKEPPLEFVRARCKALKDGSTGFLTMQGEAGVANLKPRELLVCLVSIAITTELDVAEGKSIRKLAVGEALEVVNGFSQDTERNLSRAHARALKDGVEGWVTLKGAQGTDYVEKSSRHQSCVCSLLLEDQLANGSDLVRRLDQDEVVEVLEGPLNYTKTGSIRMRGRTILDDQEGWITVTKLSSQRWSPDMRVLQATYMTDGPLIATSKRIRQLDVGEMVEAIEPPMLEEKAKVMRVRARAQKDGAVGHITLKGNKGTVFLESVVA